MVKIGHLAYDGDGFPTGGQAGIKANEAIIRTWYNKPWKKVIRLSSKLLASQLATEVIELCKNDKIGYSSEKPFELLEIAQKYNFNFSEIAEDCGCNDLTFIIAAFRGLGWNFPKEITYDTCEKTIRIFSQVTNKNIDPFNPAVLEPGDILLAENHIAVVVENDNIPKDEIYTSYLLEDADVRVGPGEKYQKIDVLKKKTNIQVLREGDWYFIRYTANNKGYIDSKKIKTFEIIPVNYRAKTTTNKVPVYSTPSNDNRSLGSVGKHKYFTITKEANGYGYCGLGWIKLTLLDKVQKI